MKQGPLFFNVIKSNVDDFAERMSLLHYLVRKQRRSANYWKWRYFDNPLGKSNLVIALRGNRVVGIYGVLYLSLHMKKELVIAGLMQDLSINPIERSWNCYRGLLERSIAKNKNDNLAFNFGIAPSNHMQLYQRFGVKSLGRAPVCVGFLNVARTLEGHKMSHFLTLLGGCVQSVAGLRLKKVNTHTTCSIQRVKTFNASFDEFWRVISQCHVLSIVKDSAYLNWRYADSSERRYECLAAYRENKVEGLIVFSKPDMHNRSFLLEFLVLDSDSEAKEMLLSHALGALKAENTGYIVAAFPVQSQVSRVLRRFRFMSWGARLWSTRIIVATQLLNGVNPELDLKNWDFSLGDWWGY